MTSEIKIRTGHYIIYVRLKIMQTLILLIMVATEGLTQ
jgi:hypothetical protein